MSHSPFARDSTGKKYLASKECLMVPPRLNVTALWRPSGDLESLQIVNQSLLPPLPQLYNRNPTPETRNLNPKTPKP